jgi:GT2 family glycosyltransferase
VRGSARALLGPIVRTAQRAVPRLERRYSRLRASTALAPGATLGQQEQRLSRYYAALAHSSDRLPRPVVFDIDLVADTAEPGQLRDALASIALQIHRSWRVRLPQPADSAAAAVLRRFAAAHPVRLLPPAAAEPAAGGTADYRVMLDARDRLLPHALAEVARWLTANRIAGRDDPVLMYGDARRVDAAGYPVGEPSFRPGWSPLLLLAAPYTGRLLFLHPRAAVAADVASPWAAALTAARRPADPVAHIPHILAQERIDPDGAARPAAGVEAAAARFRDSRGWPTPTPGGSALGFPVPDPAPRASLIIPTRDGLATLRPCVESVLSSTTYPDFDVIVVDNDSTDPDTVSYLRRLAGRPRVRVLHHPGPFNFAAMNNRAVAVAGDVLVLVNNDTEVVTADWLHSLVGLAVLPGVGAVGPQLRYPDGRVQHAGLVGLAEAGTGHAFVARDPASGGTGTLLQATREVLAVTGACLAVTREKYQSVGGLDEVLVPNDSGDVDFCLRLRERGLANVYTPRALLLHHESVSRGRSFVNFERFWLQHRWPAELLTDPYLNPNLAKNTRLDPDYRFPAADVPGQLFARWLASGSLPFQRHDHGDGESPFV